jgi:hypothetical protein
VALLRQLARRHWFSSEFPSERMDDCEIIHPTAHPELLQPYLQSTQPAGACAMHAGIALVPASVSQLITASEKNVNSSPSRRRNPLFGPDGFTVDCQGYVFGAGPVGGSVMTPDGAFPATSETNI